MSGVSSALSVEFVFPLSDLSDLRLANESQYCVEDSSQDVTKQSQNEQLDRLSEIEDRLTRYPRSLYSHECFDPLFMFLCKVKDLSNAVKRRFVETLANAASALLTKVPRSRDDTVHTCRNSVKMVSFLVCVTVRSLERHESESNTPKKKGKKKGRGRRGRDGRDDDAEYRWEMGKERLLAILGDILECEGLSRLWEMHTPDEHFGNLFFNAALAAFENQGNHSGAHSRAIVDSICRIMGLSLAKYKCNASAGHQLVRMVQLSRWANEAKAASVVATATANIVRKHEYPSLLHDVLYEIGCLGGKGFSKDTKSTRALALFLTELAEQCPALVLQKISLVMNHLDQDSYQMRNGIVCMIGKLIIHAFASESGRQETKNDLFEILEIRLLDASSYTRSKVLQVWAELAENRLIPAVRMCTSLIPQVRKRLLDKSSMVRRQAIQLLTAFIESNPWGPTVELEHERCLAEVRNLRVAVEEIEKSLSEKELAAAHRVLKQQGVEFLEEEGEGGEEEEESEEKKIEEKDTGSGSESEEKEPLCASFEELKTRRKQLFGVEMLEAFTRHMSAVSQTVGELLSSRTQSDVLECIRFFKVACVYKVANEQLGFKKMLPLVWNKDDQKVINAVLDAYHYKYIHEGIDASLPLDQQTKQALAIAAGLVKMTNGATLADITCFEELIRLMVASKSDEKMTRVNIPPQVFAALWGIFEGRLQDVTTCQRRGALDLLRMAAAANPEIILNKIDKVIDIGFGDLACGDPGMARSACMALQALRRNTDRSSPFFTRGLEERIWQRVEHILLGGFIQSPHWFSTAQEALNLIFKLHRTPDLFTQGIIRFIATKLFARNGSSEGSEEDGKELLYTRYALAKFIFVLGHTAIKLLVYIAEKESQLKRLRTEKEHLAQSNLEDEPQDELNETLGGAGVEDYEIEKMRERAEHSLVEKHTLLGRFVPMILTVIQRQNQFNCPILQSSAVLAFTKFMCVSPKFCDEHLRLLFTLLEKHADSSIRANIVIALGDMAFRFPNELDRWSQKIYKNLRDENIGVRKNTLMVLTHLILNDMIKVRDSISEIALLLLDDEQAISDLARLFFQELSKKGKNPIYNIIPDTISRLSSNNDVSDATFQFVMKFLLGFIEKDRQKENLLEKLCNRFTAAPDVRSWRNIAFCLGQLQYTERLAKKVTDPEITKKYEEKLGDVTVYQYFKDIQQKCKKHVKPEFKDTFDEWTQHLESKHCKQADDAAAHDRGMSKLKRGGRRKRKRSERSESASPVKRRARKRGRRAKEEESSEEESGDAEIDVHTTSEEESGEGSSEESKEERSVRPARRGAGRSGRSGRNGRARPRGGGRGRGVSRGRGRGRGRGKTTRRGRGRGKAAKSRTREESEEESEEESAQSAHSAQSEDFEMSGSDSGSEDPSSESDD